MPRIIWSAPSLLDLREIERFLSNEDAAAAARILRAIRGKSDQLRQFPSSGPALTGELRYVRVRNTPYLLVYRIGRGGVEVIRVRHVREDWRSE
jgi:toxin ParE1/3/4